MAGSLYGYGPPQGYQPEHIPTQQSPYNPLISRTRLVQSPDALTPARDGKRDAYQASPSLIPGLGYAHAQNNHNNNHHAYMDWRSSSHTSQANGSLNWAPLDNASIRAEAEVAGRKSHSQQIIDHDAASTMEAGEIEDGEMEDLYESGTVENLVDAHRAFEARDRSGSYSPHLSPGDIQQQSNGVTEDFRAQSSLARLRQDAPRSTELNIRHDNPESSPESNAMSFSSSTQSGIGDGSEAAQLRTVSEARKQARDAIMRLWPLNVRYQNYLEEGIDSTLLESLFKELGFEFSSPPSTTTAPVEIKPAVLPVEGPSEALIEPPKNSDPVEPSKPEKSESRKDRIARLLAAKGSKLGPAIAAASPADVSSPIISNSGTTSVPVQKPPISRVGTPIMTPSDKSKLLYQKMEALKKLRAKQGQKRPYPDQPAPITQESQPISSSVPSKTTTGSKVADHGAGNPPAVRTEQSLSSNAANEDDDDHNIPGLFLSTPQSSNSSASPMEHPQAVLTSHEPGQSFKRPFGQTRQKRPFLIDVSDDEDDAEMEIDSPEHLPTQINRPLTPLTKPTTHWPLTSAIDGAMGRQNSSPLNTPSGVTSDGSGKDDLESMTKRIEEMKRKIAEAEARKKQKPSRPVSPMPSALTGTTQNESRARSELVEASAHNPPLSKDNELGDRASTQPPHDEGSSIRPPRWSDLKKSPIARPRRSLSRAASQSLAVVKAHREKQQLKLQDLQSQIASIEKDIEHSLLEEETLKEDVVSNESEAENERISLDATSQRSEPIFSEHSDPKEVPDLPERTKTLPEGDPMELASVSSGINGASRGPSIATSVQEETSPAETSLEPARLIEPTQNDAQDVTNNAADEAETPNSVTKTISSPLTEVVQEAAQDMIPQAEEDEDSDNYEPPEAELNLPGGNSDSQSPSSPSLPSAEHTPILETGETPTDNVDYSRSNDRNPATTIQGDESTITLEDPREIDETSPGEIVGPRTNFSSYESPLQYFRAYRFHPEFKKSVEGGLRSLTYSNKVDIKKQLCPDEVAGHECPRGKQCEYQHFENMQAPDDQILLQLGAFSNYGPEQQQEFIKGLRQLLTEFRANKVKDFDTLSQGILEYRARFLGDKSKILPLGNVAI